MFVSDYNEIIFPLEVNIYLIHEVLLLHEKTHWFYYAQKRTEFWKESSFMASKLIFSPLKLVFQIALCFSQILFHKCKILTLCHLHCMIWMYNIRKFSIYTNRLYFWYFCNFVLWNLIFCFLLHFLFTLKIFFWLHRI